MAHRCAILYASQYVSDVRQGPRAQMSHRHSGIVVNVSIAVNLIVFIVHEHLADHAVGSDHLGGGVFVRIETTLKKKF